ncbi:winged helix-turn-helix domain-containing protein [soil metagenome]
MPGYPRHMEWRFADFTLDVDRRELRRVSTPVPLEPRALALLIELVEHHERVVTKEELLDSVWGDRFVSESALTTQVKAVRRAVGDTGTQQAVIKTVHGHGYRFVAQLADGADGTGGDAGNGHQHARPADANAEAATNEQPLVAVLPFDDVSSGQGSAHVAAGLASDVVTGLSRHRWLRVLTRAMSSGYQGEPDAVRRLRHDLNVGYVVEGAVRVERRRLRVTVSLTDAATGTCRWAERYDRDIEDLFDVLDEITDVVVATIEPEVGYAERERVHRGPRADLRAWDLFHLGVEHLFRFTAADNVEAQRLFDRARTIDPGFGDAQAWWAYSVVLGMTYWGTDPDRATLDEALAATKVALGVDDHNAVFHMLRGRVQLARRDYGAALIENHRAIELNPTFAAAYCGLGDSLCYEGRYDEAIEQFTRSVALGSHDPQRWAFLSYGALAHLFAGRYEEAVEWTERAAVIPNCQYWTLAHRVVDLANLGRTEQCAAAVEALLSDCPNFTITYARHKLFYLKRPEQLACYLDGLRVAGIPEG